MTNNNEIVVPESARKLTWRATRNRVCAAFAGTVTLGHGALFVAEALSDNTNFNTTVLTGTCGILGIYATVLCNEQASVDSRAASQIIAEATMRQTALPQPQQSPSAG